MAGGWKLGERLYGLDWLRTGAVGLLTFYHIGLFFVPWDRHIKAANELSWLELPMQALIPWRLPLLFLISGTASAFLLAKLDCPGALALSHSAVADSSS
jgi:glucans biosynthesis protein C